MTRREDVSAAVDLGVDAIGMILHAKSPRSIELERAKELRALIPAFVNVVGVFVDADAQLINSYSDEIGLDTVQLHGVETADYANSLNRPYIKALRVQSSEQVVRAADEFGSATGLLLDPYVAGQHGGTGQLLDTQLWPTEAIAMPLILAGGLNPDNVSQRISALNPYAIDINSGVESAPGEKDIDALSRLLDVVRSAH